MRCQEVSNRSCPVLAGAYRRQLGSRDSVNRPFEPHTLQPTIWTSSHNGQHPRHVIASLDPTSTSCARVPIADSCRHSRLYRRSLKLALDWSVHRYLWRGQALYIRSLFEANANVREPRQQRVSDIHPSPQALPGLPQAFLDYHTPPHWTTPMLPLRHNSLLRIWFADSPSPLARSCSTRPRSSSSSGSTPIPTALPPLPAAASTSATFLATSSSVRPFLLLQSRLFAH